VRDEIRKKKIDAIGHGENAAKARRCLLPGISSMGSRKIIHLFANITLLSVISAVIAPRATTRHENDDEKSLKRKRSANILTEHKHSVDGTNQEDLLSKWILEETLSVEKNSVEGLVHRLLVNGMSIRPTLSPTTDAPPTGTQIPTLSPITKAPVVDDCRAGRTNEQYLLDVLLPVSDLDAILDASTPQGEAFSFILGDATVIDDVCAYPTIEQRFGLATFYFSTNGANWTNSSNWISELPECQWFGVSCEDGFIATNITLSSNNLAGTLPNEISTLSSLTSMEFYDNQLSGSIPDGLGNITTLELLDMEMNLFTGVAFSEPILSLSSLRQLFLSSNTLTGSMPEQLFSRLPLLTDLWAANNRLVGTIPESIGLLNNISTMILYNNTLTGPLPTSLGQLSGVSNLQLYQNAFVDTLPSTLYGLTELSVLRIDGNFFTGTLSDNIGQLSKLTDLRVNDNALEGILPENFFLLPDLRIFAAGMNLFNQSIPNVFVGFQKLEYFDISSCFYSGSVPDTIFDSPSLQRAYLNNNQLTGSIPSNFASSANLIDLFLNDNQLTGSVPSIQSGQLPLLSELLLQNNALVGSIPESICSLRSSASLELLFSDCGGMSPEIQCDFPDCCTRCFEGGQAVNQRRAVLEALIANQQTDYQHGQEAHQQHRKENEIRLAGDI
jgi:hypothetical protein